LGGGCGWKGWIWKGGLEGGGFCLTTVSPSTVSPFSCLASSILSGRNTFRATFVPSTRTGSHLMQGAGTCHSRLTIPRVVRHRHPLVFGPFVPSLDRPDMLLGALCPSGGEPSAQPGEKYKQQQHRLTLHSSLSRTAGMNLLFLPTSAESHYHTYAGMRR
jgi:hypothetical protein